MKTCAHVWVWIEKRENYSASGYGRYHRVDQFYCRKCLAIECKERFQFNKQFGNSTPIWFSEIHE